VRWDDEDAITHDPLRMRDNVISRDEGHFLWCSSVRAEQLEIGWTEFQEICHLCYAIWG
jgi:hypothetical protein